MTISACGTSSTPTLLDPQLIVVFSSITRGYRSSSSAFIVRYIPAFLRRLPCFCFHVVDFCAKCLAGSMVWASVPLRCLARLYLKVDAAPRILQFFSSSLIYNGTLDLLFRPRFCTANLGLKSQISGETPEILEGSELL